MKGKDIVNRMYDHDAFSQWLGIEVKEVENGYCCCQMTVRKEMINGFGIAHGGISYSLADSALAFASNSYGKHAVSIETSISHTKAIKVNDIITAKANVKNQGSRLGIYEVIITNQQEEIVALFKGTVFIKETNWE